MRDRSRHRADLPGWPGRPAAAWLLAAAVVLIWLGLPFGAWLPMTAVVPDRRAARA